MPKVKRPYQPPRIATSAAFERMALSCSGQNTHPPSPKHPGQNPHCTTVGAS